MFESSNSIHKHIILDIVTVITLTVFTWIIARYFNLTERFYFWSRAWEDYQVDEFLFPLFIFSIGLIWFSFRRYQHVKIKEFNNRLLLSENRRLVTRVTETQDKERLFLAQELHDIFAQYLTALRTNSETIQASVGGEKMAVLNAAKMISDNVEKLHHITRSLLKTLRPPPLEFGLVMAVEDLVTEWQHSHHSIDCQLNFHGEQMELCEESLLALYRTIQEGLSNISRHSNAKNVVINIYFPEQNNSEKSFLKLQIIDNGVGFNRAIKEDGVGLVGLRERANSLNGQFNITDNSPSGSIMHLTLPINNTAHH